MSAESITLAGRAAAERNMLDACTITRVTGQTTNLQNGQVTDTVETIYSGKCSIQQNGRLSRPTTVAGAYVFQTAYELKLPIATSAGVDINDVVNVTAAVLDPDLAGRTYWVRELAAKSFATARRLGVEEVSG